MGDPQKMSYIAGEAMTAPRGLPVKVSAARTVVLCDSGASGEESIGVIDQDTDVANGGELTVAVLGTPRQYKAGAAITAGTHHFLMTETATGRVIPATSGNEACAYFCGLQDAADGDLVYAIPFRYSVP